MRVDTLADVKDETAIDHLDAQVCWVKEMEEKDGQHGPYFLQRIMLKDVGADREAPAVYATLFDCIKIPTTYKGFVSIEAQTVKGKRGLQGAFKGTYNDKPQLTINKAAVLTFGDQVGPPPESFAPGEPDEPLPDRGLPPTQAPKARQEPAEGLRRAMDAQSMRDLHVAYGGFAHDAAVILGAAIQAGIIVRESWELLAETHAKLTSEMLAQREGSIRRACAQAEAADTERRGAVDEPGSHDDPNDDGPPWE